MKDVCRRKKFKKKCSSKQNNNNGIVKKSHQCFEGSLQFLQVV